MANFDRSFKPGKLLGVVLATSCAHAHALGLGNLVLHSSLGTPLSASVQVNGIDTDTPANLCLRSRLESVDGRLLTLPQSTLSRNGSAAEIQLRSKENVDEPAATLSIELGCGATVRREFAILLDPAPEKSATTAGVAQGVVSSASGIKSAALTRGTPKPAAVPGSRTEEASSTRMRRKGSAASVLRLSTPPQLPTQPNIVPEAPHLKMTDMLSESHLASDPVRREAMRADQARVAALLRGEDPYQAAESRTRQAQMKEQVMRREAILSKQQGMADRQALEEAGRQRWMDACLAGLASALLALGAGAAWLRWRGARERRAADAFSLEALDAGSHDAPRAEPIRRAAPQQEPSAAAGLAPLYTDRVSAGGTAPMFTPSAEPAPTQALADEVPEADAAPLEFGLAWHASNETVMRPEPPAPVAAEVANSLDWLNDADTEAAAPAPQAAAAAAETAALLLGVEAWMADHNPLRAIGMLEPACAREPQASPAPMRYLIELYRLVGEEEKLATTQVRFVSLFALEGEQDKSAWLQEAPALGLSDFPEILADIERLGDGSDLLAYLQGLLLRKEAFDFPVYREIMHRIAATIEVQQERDMPDMSLEFHHG